MISEKLFFGFILEVLILLNSWTISHLFSTELTTTPTLICNISKKLIFYTLYIPIFFHLIETFSPSTVCFSLYRHRIIGLMIDQIDSSSIQYSIISDFYLWCNALAAPFSMIFSHLQIIVLSSVVIQIEFSHFKSQTTTKLGPVKQLNMNYT